MLPDRGEVRLDLRRGVARAQRLDLEHAAIPDVLDNAPDPGQVDLSVQEIFALDWEAPS